MTIKLEQVEPAEIERRSFEIIREELGERRLDPDQESVIIRAIHTTADFDYADNLLFSDHAVIHAVEALRNGAHIVTDTQMAASGVKKALLHGMGGQLHCFMSDATVADEAKRRSITRATVCMEQAAKLEAPMIVAVGNAPTALVRLHELIQEGRISPKLIIGVPVGFVNVVEAKELIMTTGVPYIVARGRKGGSNVAAAICNALLLKAGEKEETE